MAETKLHNYSVQEKLNKMDLDVIQVIPTIDFDTNTDATPDAFTVNDVVAPVTKIPNAVAVNGGVSILQTCIIVDIDAQDVTHELFFFGRDPDEGEGTIPASNVAVTGIDEDDIFYNNQFLGQISLGSPYVLGTCGFYELSNIGKLLKATSDAKDIYFFSIVTGGTEPTYTTATSLEFRFGVIKD